MRNRIRFIGIIAIAISLFIPSSCFAANPKTGAKCTKIGLTQNYAGKKYTCIKSGKLQVWNKGVVTSKPTVKVTPSPLNSGNPDLAQIKAGDQCASSERGIIRDTTAGKLICKHDDISAYRWFQADIAIASSSSTSTPSPSPSPSPTKTQIDWSKKYSTDDGYQYLYNGPCQFESNTEPQWTELQKVYYSNKNCSGIYHVAKYELGKETPKTSNSISSTSPIDQCKIAEPSDSMALRGFYSKWNQERINWTRNHWIPNSKMVIQLIPIYADDTAKPKNSPEQDYKKYLNFLKDWVEHSADQGSSVEIRYPAEYLKFNGNLGSYGVYHENRYDSPNHVKFNKDLVAQVDPHINFSGVNVAIIVTPAGTPLSVLQQGTIGELNTNEGIVYVSTTEYPYSLENLSSVKFSNFLVPFWWVHEIFHSGIGFTDHYGDDKHDVSTDYGLGWWTLMTPWGGDLSAWEKWVLGFLGDSQIHCFAPNTTNVSWIAPSSVKTTQKKLIIIPISEYKGIAIESIRPAGLYYKIPKESAGVLVYEIDLTVKFYDSGLRLVLPTNRNPNQPPFFLSQATLRQGESVLTNGQRITIVESGNFGDVVKVEKA